MVSRVLCDCNEALQTVIKRAYFIIIVIIIKIHDKGPKPLTWHDKIAVKVHILWQRDMYFYFGKWQQQ